VDSGALGNPTVDAVVFDLDGVLIDSEPVWEKVRRAVVAEEGGRWMQDTQRRLMGMGTAEWARYLSNDLGVRLTPEEVVRTVVGRMEAAYERKLPMLPGAAEAVRRIGGRWRLGLASSSPPEIIHLVLARAGLTDAFAATVSSDEAARGKPAPDVYLAAARRLGVEPENAAAVEDSSNGLRSAAAAGFRVVAIPRPSYPPDPDALGHASLVLDGLGRLTPEALESLG